MNGPLPPAEPRTAAAHPLSRLVGSKLGNFRLERLIGRGRMGAVYLAKDEALLRPTAVKVLAWADEVASGHDPVQWFLAEARLVARINDPRVVQIYGAARHGDWFYIAMEYVPGRSCEAHLEAAGRLAPEVATDVIYQAASALSAAHRSGVVHRDVKPANLLMTPGGVTKLGDFGMAHGPAGAGVGQARVRAGTPFYTAPEIWRSGSATPASDLYALGATYFHLLTGRPPYQAVDVSTVERAHLHSPVPDPAALVAGLPTGCGALVRRLLAKAPAERPHSAQEVMREAERLLRSLAPGRFPERRRAEEQPPAAPFEPAAADPVLREGAATAVEPPPRDALGFVRRPFGPDDAHLQDLAAAEIGPFLAARVRSARAAGAPALLFSPDAVQLLAFRSGGRPLLLGRLAGNALLLAAIGGSRTVTSWHAWTASEQADWNDAPLPSPLPARPAGWPTPDAAALLDAARLAAGLPPFPRPPERRTEPEPP